MSCLLWLLDKQQQQKQKEKWSEMAAGFFFKALRILPNVRSRSFLNSSSSSSTAMATCTSLERTKGPAFTSCPSSAAKAKRMAVVLKLGYMATQARY
jgi:hypothetical protein